MPNQAKKAVGSFPRTCSLWSRRNRLAVGWALTNAVRSGFAISLILVIKSPCSGVPSIFAQKSLASVADLPTSESFEARVAQARPTEVREGVG